jgi:hypothetical protein
LNTTVRYACSFCPQFSVLLPFSTPLVAVDPHPVLVAHCHFTHALLRYLPHVRLLVSHFTTTFTFCVTTHYIFLFPQTTHGISRLRVLPPFKNAPLPPARLLLRLRCPLILWPFLQQRC